jgi:hypothetical protein
MVNTINQGEELQSHNVINAKASGILQEFIPTREKKVMHASEITS